MNRTRISSLGRTHVAALVFAVLSSACSDSTNNLTGPGEGPVNAAPVASAGADRTVSAGGVVQLDGTGSSDPDGDALRYTWTQTTGPSVGTLAATSAPTFNAPSAISTLEFSLVVDDGQASSAPATVRVTVLADRDAALFVAPSGSDGNAGTREAPFATIQAAIEAARSSGSDVYVAGGTYEETLSLARDVSLYGGFDAQTWQRDVNAYRPTVRGGSVAVTAQGAHDIVIEGFRIEAADAADPGESSVAMRVVDATAVRVLRTELVAADGSAGRNGSVGRTGSRGNGGSSGAASGVCSNPGGSGGSGA
ncbi:MAG: DUF1565 domain-containing protein, partial [Gemmatimonadetes bacterium]|nr:DUF1565 domain-containing protein [Gemmatimonadota bacterium]